MKSTPLYITVQLLAIWMAACTNSSNPANIYPATDTPPPTPSPPTHLLEGSLTPACPVTEPEWLKPPDDAAVQGSPGYGYYFVNADRPIWASAWWEEAEGYSLKVSEEGVKVGWFRPAGADLVITGERIDAPADSLVRRSPAATRPASRPQGCISQPGVVGK